MCKLAPLAARTRDAGVSRSASPPVRTARNAAEQAGLESPFRHLASGRRRDESVFDPWPLTSRRSPSIPAGSLRRDEDEPAAVGSGTEDLQDGDVERRRGELEEGPGPRRRGLARQPTVGRGEAHPTPLGRPVEPEV